MIHQDWLLECTDGVLIRLQIQPQASRNEIVGIHGEPPRLKVRITAPPVEGRANEALLEFLKKILKIGRGQLILQRGSTSKFKDVICSGLTLDVIRDRLIKV